MYIYKPSYAFSQVIRRVATFIDTSFPYTSRLSRPDPTPQSTRDSAPLQPQPPPQLRTRARFGATRNTSTSFSISINEHRFAARFAPTTSKMASFRYTHAVVCRIPTSFKTNAIGVGNECDLDEARKQHEEYCRSLREMGLDVIELPADESLPDCVFVEDTAVVCNGTALITKPGHLNRKKEVETMRRILKKELELPIVEIQDESATIDGGDVLFTGKEFFVGLSSRTNEAGARAVAAAFPEFPVTPIKVSSGLHLKSSVSVAGPDILCVGASAASQEIIKRIEREATFRYQTITVPDDDAANCVYANGTLLHRADYPESAKVFVEKFSCPRLPVDFSEIGRAQAHLTCGSILINKNATPSLTRSD